MAATFIAEIPDEVSQEPRPDTEKILPLIIINGISELAFRHSVPMSADSIEVRPGFRRLNISVNSDPDVPSPHDIIRIIAEGPVIIVRKKSGLELLDGSPEFMWRFPKPALNVLNGYLRDYGYDQIKIEIVIFHHYIPSGIRKHHRN